MTIKTRRVQLSSQIINAIPFLGLRDEKGREVGVLVYTREVEFVEIEADAVSWRTHAPGRFIEVRVQAARNGFPYGAWQREHYAADAAASSAHIAKAIAATRARYNKKYAAR